MDLPQRRVSRPVANGSSVPPWPILLIPSSERAQEASWWLDGPGGLSIRITPQSKRSCRDLASGLQPNEGFVLAFGSKIHSSAAILLTPQFITYQVENFPLIFFIRINDEGVGDKSSRFIP